MSLLLEALKRAALEKQSKQEAGAEVPAPKQPSFVPSAAPDPIAAEVDDAPVAADNPIETPVPEDIADTDAGFNDTLDQEDDIEPIEQVDEAELEDWEDFDAADFLDDETEEEVGNFDFSEKEPEAPLKPLALEETEQSLQEARLQQEELLKEQEEIEAREKEALENRQDEQRKITARENRHALDQLIASGKAVAKRSRRRAVFLYAMLVMTALGGILAYYFYLLANSSIAELQQTTQQEPVIDIAEIIESTELESVARSNDSNNASEVIDSSPQTSLSGTVGTRTGGEMGSATSTNNITESSTGANAATRSAAPGLEDTPLEIARRADPAPSVTAYLQPLITSEERGVQRSNVTDRVIIHHEKSSGDLNTLIKDAYTALQQKDLDRASRLYDEALNISPGQRDALLGAAAAATASGRFNDAASFYQKQLAADPKDNFARAGLLALMNDGKSRAAVQQEVSDMLKINPRSAHLHFLKGVGFAAGNRWSLAQSAFYEAYNLDNKNPDYAFNLAVALDHLNQTPLARIYYERALSLAQDRPANFDAAAVARRLEGLKSL